MKKIIRKTAWVLAAFGIGGGLVSGCSDIISSPQAEEIVNGIVDDVKEQAQEEIKKAIANEIGDFFESSDLSRTLGISGDEQTKLENSIKDYINNYDADEKQLDDAKQAVKSLLENTEGMSAEQIEEKISEIFNATN